MRTGIPAEPADKTQDLVCAGCGLKGKEHSTRRISPSTLSAQRLAMLLVLTVNDSITLSTFNPVRILTPKTTSDTMELGCNLMRLALVHWHLTPNTMSRIDIEYSKIILVQKPKLRTSLGLLANKTLRLKFQPMRFPEHPIHPKVTSSLAKDF